MVYNEEIKEELKFSGTMHAEIGQFEARIFGHVKNPPKKKLSKILLDSFKTIFWEILLIYFKGLSGSF